MPEELTQSVDEKSPHGEGSHEQEIDWKAASRKWESRAKENAEAAKELARLKEERMSEIEKAQKRAEKAEAELKALRETATQAKLKREIAKEYGVPDDLLAGSSEEEIRAHAERLKQYVTPPSAPKTSGAGSFAKSTGNTSTKSQLANQIFSEI